MAVLRIRHGARGFGTLYVRTLREKHTRIAHDKARVRVVAVDCFDSCFQCHLDVHAEFNLPQHHPVVEGRMNCVDCHDPHGGDIFKPAGGSGLAMARTSESCEQCHRDQTRPFVFMHEAMREGCVVCHQPHGSVNEKMLIISDPNLCLRCHSQVQGPTVPAGHIYIGNTDHTFFLQSGTCWTAGCHTAVHGSNVDPRLRY